MIRPKIIATCLALALAETAAYAATEPPPESPTQSPTPTPSPTPSPAPPSTESPSALPVLGTNSAWEPWTDWDPKTAPKRYSRGDFGFRGSAEYRAQWLYVHPISLNTETGRNVSLLQQRLRLDATADFQDKIRIVFSSDVFDGDLFGDNGTYGGNPSSNAGTSVDAKNPNDTRPCIGQRDPNGDPLSPSSYGVTLCPIQPLTIRRLYGEAVLPFGVFRVGRQAVIEGMGILSNDGDGRENRFGVAGTGNYVDRVLFATKPLEAFNPAAQRDTSSSRGLIVGIAYDRIVQDDPQSFSDDVHQLGGVFRYGKSALGPLRDLYGNLYFAHRWQDGMSDVNSVGLRMHARIKDFSFGVDSALNFGTTREVSQAYQKITNDPVVDQTVLQGGARAVMRYDRPKWSLYLEGDYASGSDDPSSRATLSQFTWAADTNVGLLLFKQVLAFQTGRAAAAGVELLRRLGATTFPAQAIDTQGAVTNALVLFPQADFHPTPNLLVRPGVMLAWTATPLIDPIQSLQNRKSVVLQDDLVNFAGGKPGRFYGTELDLHLQYRFLEHFLFDVEGAVLFPGDALQNVDGYAITSYLLQTRATFFL